MNDTVLTFIVFAVIIVMFAVGRCSFKCNVSEGFKYVTPHSGYAGMGGNMLHGHVQKNSNLVGDVDQHWQMANEDF